MHTLVSVDGEIVPAERTFVPAVSPATLYGKGVFTTLAIYDRVPFLWEKHWRRLSENAVSLGIDHTAHSGDQTRLYLDDLTQRNNVGEGRARITLFDQSTSGFWNGQNGRKSTLLIMTADRRPLEHRPRITMSSHLINSRSPLAGVKSCNYLEHLLAYEDAKGRGFDEAVRLNERGHITSACMANVFWLKDGKLFTPLLATGCLAGTTREFIREDLECEEVEAGRSDIEAADAIFLTSAGIGVVAAAEFEGRKLHNVGHPILDLLQKPQSGK
jgi:branched-subunit amino acid aminotransferase/4-amino-4-deoxychorismate lyase